MVGAVLDRFGRPFGLATETAAPAPKNGRANGVAAKSAGTVLQIGGEYQESLGLARAAAMIRARDPFLSSTWVFAAAVAKALASSQAEWKVYRETEEELRLRAKRLGPERAVPRAGRHRRAVQRWINRSALSRAVHTKALEPVFSHPVVDLFLDPNPYQSGNELMVLTVLWLSVRGEACWVLTDEEGMPSGLDLPDRIWPVPPDNLKPVYETPQGGEVIAWDLRQPRWMAGYRSGVVMRLPLSSLVQFKLPNPADIARGLSPLSATAGTIEMALMMSGHLRKLIANGAVPPTILYSEEAVDPKTEQVLRENFEQLGKEGRTAFLGGGLRALMPAMSPQQMGFLEFPEYLRDEQLAAMGTPLSALGLSIYTNYATARVNELGLWERGIVPVLKIVEARIDSKFFTQEPDSTFGMFDLTGVDALRAGVMEKLQAASAAAGGALHMPPRVAIDAVGLDGIPEYEGDDVAFGTLGAVPVHDILSGAVPAPAPPPPAADPELEDPDTEDDTEADDEPAAARRGAPHVKQRKPSRNAEFVELQAQAEEEMARVYRGWVAGERKLVLDAFDALGGRARARLKETDPIDLHVVLPVGKESAKRFALASRKLQVESLLRVAQFSEKDIGVPTFELDDEAFLSFFRRHEGHFSERSADSIRTNLASALEAGIRDGDSLSEMRTRIAQVFDISASSPKTLLVARTSTASFMNGARDQMFQLQGFTKALWDTSGDEHVRVEHEAFGAAGPQELGFNWLTLVGIAGVLMYPGDFRAPFGQVANCRCSSSPAE